MAGLNKVLLIGNVGGDPEIRVLSNGSKVANFSIATSETYVDKNGQRQTQTEWHRIEIWEGLATVVEKYVKKGDPLYIEGKIKNERWTDQNGVEKTGVRIRATSMQMLGNASKGSSASSSSTEVPVNAEQASHQTNKAVPDTTLSTETAEDDLPF